MEEIEVTWGKAVVFWWALTWRTFLYGAIIGAIIGLIAGVILAAISLPVEEYSTQVSFISFAIGMIVSMSVTKDMLSKNFKGFRVALIRMT